LNFFGLGPARPMWRGWTQPMTPPALGCKCLLFKWIIIHLNSKKCKRKSHAQRWKTHTWKWKRKGRRWWRRRAGWSLLCFRLSQFFSSVPCFPFSVSLVFFPDVLPLFFYSSVRISLLSQFNSSCSPSVLSYFLPCVCLLLFMSSSVFPLSRCLFFFFPLAFPSGFPSWFSTTVLLPLPLVVFHLAFIAKGCMLLL